MYFPDLSPYSYSLPEPLPGVLTVGWLSAPNPFATGVIEPAHLDTLKYLAVSQAPHQMRGYSHCELCGRAQPELEYDGRRRTLGSAEVWVPHATRDGVIFAAPNLVVHYTEAHAYLPPREFLEALAAVDRASWNAEEACEHVIEEAWPMGER